MAARKICIALLLSVLPSAGCGTVANVARTGPNNGMTPFGGVKQDLACLQQAANGEFAVKAHAQAEADHYPSRALRFFCAADLPLSLIGDIVTWPYTVSYAFINQPIPPAPVTFAPPTVGVSDLPPIPPVTKPMPIPIAPVPEAKADQRPQASSLPIPIPPVAEAKADDGPRLFREGGLKLFRSDSR